MYGIDESRCKKQFAMHHALNLCYFESMLMLIVILWLIKWLFACVPPMQSAIVE